MTKAELSQKVFFELCDYFDIDKDQVIAMTINLEIDKPIVVDVCRFAGSEDRQLNGGDWKTRSVRHTFEVIDD